MSAERILAIAGVVILLIMGLTLSACGQGEVRHVVDTVEVKVPVLEVAPAPQELYRTKLDSSAIPVFVGPTNPAATVCLTSEGEPKLKSLVRSRESLLDGWERYGSFSVPVAQ